MNWLWRAARRLGWALLATAVLVSPQRAAGESRAFENALALVRSNDVDRIERTFDADYRAFVDGELPLRDYIEAYNAFYTLDPVVLDMLAEWRAAYPGSAHLRIAEAGPKMHLAAVLRGESVIGLVPRRNLERARQLWRESLMLYEEALDIAPQHVKAARGLQDTAFDLGEDAAALRAKRVRAVYDAPSALLLTELVESSPKWGGSEARMRRLCDDIAPKIEGIRLEECHARATLILWHQPEELRLEAIETLRRIDEDNNRKIIASKLLRLGRAEEALALLDEVDAWIAGSLADDFARALNNYAVQERIVDRWIAVNPLTPRHLAMKSEAQAMRGDHAGAAESIEKAMIYGETIPEVRNMRLAAMMRDESRHEDVLGEFEDALVDTEFHPLVMERVAGALVWSPEHYRYWSDGSEHSHFECRRARILSYAFASCAAHWSRQNTLGCLDETLMRIQEILGEVDLHACAAAIGTFR